MSAIWDTTTGVQRQPSVDNALLKFQEGLREQTFPPRVKVLFLHGWHSVPGGVKPSYFIQHGHEVINPALSDDDFYTAVQQAQDEFDKHRPDVIVGSSRGGAIAMAIQSDRVPLVLLCPAWKRWGNVRIAKPNTTILHSRNDDVIPFTDSEALITASGLPRTALIETGNDHRLADPDSLKTMLEVCLSREL